MKKYIILILLCGSVFADCSLDHLYIGCNEDGIIGTADDSKLFLDCSLKYRDSDIDPTDGTVLWLNWFYPLQPTFYGDYRLNEPGFDVISNSNRELSGTKNVDYEIIIECIDISENFSAIFGSTIISQPGDFINHSLQADSHLHLVYRAPSPEGSTNLFWITLRLVDSVEMYEASEPVTVVFGQLPAAGDVYVDGHLDILDVEKVASYWLYNGSSAANDYFERSDINKDGVVNLLDFAVIAGGWVK